MAERKLDFKRRNESAYEVWWQGKALGLVIRMAGGGWVATLPDKRHWSGFRLRRDAAARLWSATHGDSTPPAQPSALASVTDALNWLRDVDRSETGQRLAFDGLRAIASLVSEVRAEERKACIADAAHQCVCATAPGGCGCSACRTAERIRARGPK